MSETNSVVRYRGLWLLAILVGFLFTSMALTVYLYRQHFGTTLAPTSSEWSNFGSFFGGLFGPLVSIVTLVAVVVTVYMQRELLDAQSDEFNELMIKQDDQLTLARSEANRAKVQAYQATLLNSLATFAAEFRQDASEQLAAAEKVGALDISILAKTMYEADHRGRADDARQKVAAFTILAFELSVAEYSSVDEIKEKFVPEMQRILGL